jgi:NAD(P)-dependent dehydrogenase (short-subunit alcohol dehydrogenase family)
MDLGLTGRTVVVTGASSGVGLATAAMLLAEGAHVAACARDADRLAAAFDGLPRAADARVLLRACDVLDADAVADFVGAAAAELGGIDRLVNNAGRSLMRRVLDTTEQEWADELRLKVFGALHPVRAALPWLRKSPAPAVVTVNAILARQPEARLAATSAARAALLNLTTTLAGELAADRGIALGRLGVAEEVAFPIVALLSPRSSYVTGASLDVGGGVARYVCPLLEDPHGPAPRRRPAGRPAARARRDGCVRRRQRAQPAAGRGARRGVDVRAGAARGGRGQRR